MASPPAADPPTTTASTPIPVMPFATATRPSSNSLASNPSPHQKQQIFCSVPVRPPTTTPVQLPKSPQTQGVLYPVASSGRGFIPKSGRPPDHSSVTIASRSALPFTSQQQHLMGSLKGVPVPTPAKIATASSPSTKSAANGYKDTRDRNKDDSLVVVRDRKVRLLVGDSLYGLGRSWLRNGFPEESMCWQPQYGDFAKTLPRPLPVADSCAVDGKPNENEDDKEEDVKDLSAKDLLKGHIRRAKRVRLRAKEERMKRILRFRTRIALLLPPEVEQFRHDAAAGT